MPNLNKCVVVLSPPKKNITFIRNVEKKKNAGLVMGSGD